MPHGSSKLALRDVQFAVEVVEADAPIEHGMVLPIDGVSEICGMCYSVHCPIHSGS